MASNEQAKINRFEGATNYQNLTPAPDLDQKTLHKMAWRSCFLQASFNYERMQAAGWLYSILPGLEKIHADDKEDLALSMTHNMEFFNIHPFLVTFAMGIILSMEQKKVDIPTIRAVRVSLMGPLGGIGDALFWMTLVPITAGICSNMAIAGNVFGPILFLIIFNAVQFALRFGLMNWSYKMGMTALDSLMDHMQAFTRAASILSVEEAKKNGIELHYVNTSKGDAVAELMALSGGTGYNDVLVFAPVAPVVEQADAILAFDGCLNFFAGPSKKDFSAKFNFYNVHYNYTHIVGTYGGNTDDMREALSMMSEGKLNPAILVTHIGGLDAAKETTLNLPSIPGGKKLIYTHVEMPLTAIEDFGRLGETDPRFAKLDEICKANNGLWCKAAEDYVLANWKAE